MSIRTAYVVLATLACIISSVTTAALLVVRGQVSLSFELVLEIVAVVILLVAVSCIIGYAFAQPLRRRIYEIEEGAVLLAAGRLQHRVSIMGNGDEIDDLCLRFNEMGEKLQQQVKMLQELAEENKQLAAESERTLILEERQRLARELHDSVSQELFALTMLSAAALRRAGNSSAEVRKTIEQINGLANAAGREMRALLLHLRPVELEGRSLEEAVGSFLSAVEERHHFKTHLAYQVENELSSVIEQNLFRILQEAVANVLKHAQASQVQVEVLGDERHVEMSILDDGVGIEQESTGNDSSYGLQSMRERAEALGGTLDVWKRSQGTGVRVVIPIFEVEGEK